MLFINGSNLENHVHDNKEILEKINVNENNCLLFNDKKIEYPVNCVICSLIPNITYAASTHVELKVQKTMGIGETVNGKYIIPEEGYWLFILNIMSNNSASWNLSCNILKNGSAISGGNILNTSYQSHSVSAIVYAYKGDSLYPRMYSTRSIPTSELYLFNFSGVLLK